MLRAVVSNVIFPSAESSNLLLFSLPSSLLQTRGRRRTLTPPPWIPPKYAKKFELIDENNKKLLDKVISLERQIISSGENKKEIIEAKISPIDAATRRVGLLVRKIGMLPQWTVTGDRILCTVLEVAENHIVNVTSPEEWYRSSIIGKRKAFNREGPLNKVTVGAINDDAYKYTNSYRNQFAKAQVPTKKHLGAFLVTDNALPQIGMPLDARHFTIGQFVTATGKSIDWGFQGGMHRWGMRGQPARRTTKSHRRIGSVGSVGDARIWPGKRMPGHMGYEWTTVSGLQIVRINPDKQVIYIKGSVPGEVGDVLQLKDCLQVEKKIKTAPLPTWTPSFETIQEEGDDSATDLKTNEQFIPQLFRFTSPSIMFSDADSKKAAGRDKTKAKIAKVKK